MIKFLFLLALVILSARCFPVLAPEPVESCKRDYYRGVFVMCNVANLGALRSMGLLLLDCKEQLRDAHERDWYGKEAPGFEWPLAPEPMSSVS